MAMTQAMNKTKGITRGYLQVTRADGTVEKVIKVTHVAHPNPLKKLFYILKERMRD